MLSTALECANRGLQVAAVHDCYWTHASDMDLMRDILWDTFREMHVWPLLSVLRDEFLLRYPGLKFGPLPPAGNLDLSKLKLPLYMFA